MTETPSENESAETERSTEESTAKSNELDSGQTVSDQTEDRSPETERIDMTEARQIVIDAADQLLDHQLEDVIKVESNDAGWRVVLEVIEREAVPDTQDILGRYEFSVDTNGNVSGYELSERYRRDELKEEF